MSELREPAAAPQREDPAHVVAREQAQPGGLSAVPEAIAGALARSDAASREEVIARLQSAGGNLGVGQLLRLDLALAVRLPRAPRRSAPSATRSPRRSVALRTRAPGRLGGATRARGLAEGCRARRPAEGGAVRGDVEARGRGRCQGAAAGSCARSGRNRGRAGAGTGGGRRATPAAAAPTAAAGPTPAGPEAGTGGGGTGEGAPTKLPDIHLPALAEVERCDSVVGAFGYNGSITRAARSRAASASPARSGRA